MSPETLFQIANPIAMLGWVALAFAPFAPRLTDQIAAIVIPLLMSVAYSALILAYWSGASGGYSSLQQVMALFTDPHIALAGWVHYLAFDLFVGAWAVRTARTGGIPHLLVLPQSGADLPFRSGGLPDLSGHADGLHPAKHQERSPVMTALPLSRLLLPDLGRMWRDAPAFTGLGLFIALTAVPLLAAALLDPRSFWRRRSGKSRCNFTLRCRSTSSRWLSSPATCLMA